MKKTIKYTIGDATEPIGDGNKVIVHCVNDIGVWGAGFVLALSKKWTQPEVNYRDWSENKATFKLGKVQFVPVEEDIIVANMIGQHKTRWENGIPPVRYTAVQEGLQSIVNYCLENNASMHCPRFCAGLAGGEWSVIEELIQQEVCDKGIDVTVYDFEDVFAVSYIPPILRN